MSDISFRNVKDAIGDGQPYDGINDVIVFSNNNVYKYSNISVYISYNIRYEQMDISILWEDDYTQINYKTLGLHGVYNTNFQNFVYENGDLIWYDGNNKIVLKSIGSDAS